MVELTSPSESPGGLGSRLPANLLLNLVPLTLVCLQHCASMGSSSVALEVDDSNSASDITSLLNKHLFEALVELLVAVPQIINDMLSLLQKIMSGMGFLTVLLNSYSKAAFLWTSLNPRWTLIIYNQFL